MIQGRGTPFRFVTIYSRDQTYGDQVPYIFLLHKPTVLLRRHWEYNYNILDDGRLIIWEPGVAYKNPPEIKGMIFKADDPLVVELNKALLEESSDNMLLNKEKL
jgi:hypothetical protein